jgi:hypothetical protein
MLVYEFHCLSCRQRLRVQVGRVRPHVKCPKCGKIFRLPLSGQVRLAKSPRNEAAWRAAFRLTDATGVFLTQAEQDAFFQRAYTIVNDLIDTRRFPAEPSRN